MTRKLDEDFCRCTAMDNGGLKWHPLHSALILGNIVEAKRVYEETINQSTLLTTKNPKGWAALHFASHSGRSESVEWLLGLPSCDPGVRTLKGETALHLAAALGHETICNLLLKGRCPPEAVTREGRSALHYSAEMGHLSVTRLLVVGAGISPDAPDSNGATAAALALAKNHKPVLRLLQKSFPGVMVSINRIRRHPCLASANENSVLPVVAGRTGRRRGGQSRFEISFESEARGPGIGSGIGARRVEDTGHSLLQAARIGDTVIMAEVLAKGEIGVDWVRRSSGRTAVMEAAENGSLEGICLLGDRGADLERSNKKGLTALQLSVRSGHLAVAEELLRRGARPNVVTKAGLCLRCLAQSEGHNYLTDWLLANGVADGENGGCACVRRIGADDHGRGGKFSARFLSVRPVSGGSGDLSSGQKRSPPENCANGAGARWEKTSQTTALGEWLEKLGLREYEDKLVSQGFDTLEAMSTATEPDLEEMGFKKGHLRLLLARAPAAPVTKQAVAALAKVDATLAATPIGPSKSHFPVGRNGRPLGGRTGAWGKETSVACGRNGIVELGEGAAATGVSRGFHDKDDEVEGGPYCDAQALDPTGEYCMGNGNENDVAGEGRAGAEGFKELSPEEIDVSEVIGEGSFGIVRRGQWRGMDVAVKELKVPLSCFNSTSPICTERSAEVEAGGLRLAEAGRSTLAPALASADTGADVGACAGAGALSRHPLRMPSLDGEEEMRHEARMLAKVCNHDCVVQFVGVLLRPIPSVVTRFMENGSVEDLLVSSNKPATKDLVARMASEAAKGVIHLHREGVVHRDLASRNLLLNDGLHVRISDFGFSRVKRECASRGYTRSDMGPIKWTSPEAMRKRCYSEASDAFSFGVVLYEMFARRGPWEGHENLDVAFRVCSGERMTVPADVDEEILGLMFRCWEGDPRARPDFSFILDTLVRFASELVMKGGDTMVEPRTHMAERVDSIARAAAAKAAKEAAKEAANRTHPTVPSESGRVVASGDDKSLNHPHAASEGTRRNSRRDRARDRNRNRDRGVGVVLGRGPLSWALDHAGSGRRPCPTGPADEAGTGDSTPSADSSYRSKPLRGLRAGLEDIVRTRFPREAQHLGNVSSFSRAIPSRGGGQRGGEDVRRGRLDGGRGREGRR